MGQVRTLDPIIRVCPGRTQPTFDSVRICLKPKLLVEVNHLRLQEQQGRGSGVNKCGGSSGRWQPCNLFLSGSSKSLSGNALASGGYATSSLQAAAPTDLGVSEERDVADIPPQQCAHLQPGEGDKAICGMRVAMLTIFAPLPLTLPVSRVLPQLHPPSAQ